MDMIIRSEPDGQIAQPWNKGKLTGAKPPLRPKHVWAVRTRLQLTGRLRDFALLTSPLTANFVAATSSHYTSLMWRPTVMRSIEPRFANAKQGDPFALRSRSKRARRSTTISLNGV